jgi:hypothetical protein
MSEQKRIIIGFETTEEFKSRIIKAGKNYKVNGIPFPLKLSAFCRMATEILMRKVEDEIKD